MPLSTAAGVASRATCLVNAPHPQQLEAATTPKINSPVVKLLESLDMERPPAQAFTLLQTSCHYRAQGTEPAHQGTRTLAPRSSRYWRSAAAVFRNRGSSSALKGPTSGQMYPLARDSRLPAMTPISMAPKVRQSDLRE